MTLVSIILKMNILLNKNEIISKMLDRVMIIITVLQLIAIIVTCSIGIYMTHLELYFEQIYIIPAYALVMLGIIILNKKMLNKVNNML